MKRRQLFKLTAQSAAAAIAASAALSLSACGFRLRGAGIGGGAGSTGFAFDALHSKFAPSSDMGLEFARTIQSSALKVFSLNEKIPPELLSLGSARSGKFAVLDVLQDQREKVVVGMGVAGQVREFSLRVRLRYRLSNAAGKVLIEDDEILVQRDISFNETAVISKEAEEALLYRSLQSDVVGQLLRRLAAVKSL